MPEDRQITIKALKYDGSIRRTWQAGLLTENEDLLVAVGVFEHTVEHSDLGTVLAGTVSFEYFWPERWYNVFLFREPSGEFRNFYCNIAMPPRVQDGVIEFVDLDVDVVIWPDGMRQILDIDDFERNSDLYGYPPEIKTSATDALNQLLAAIEAREFPFDQATNAAIGDI